MESDRITNQSNPFANGDSEELEEIIKKLMMTEEQIKQEKIKKIKEKIDNF